MDKQLHIVSFDIPYPANYGGVIDVFYKLKMLHSLGVKIFLHCFQYGSRTPHSELEIYCEKVFYYLRKTGIAGVSMNLPYIVSSRNSQELLNNLVKIQAPILFEGIHTTFHLQNEQLKNRIKIVRAHNIESDYYRLLAHNSDSVVKKVYYFWESWQLKNYENGLTDFSYILPISENDTSCFQTQFPGKNIVFLPPFHQYNQIESKVGRGNYCLYHGNLSVAENRRSVDFLIQEVFCDMDIPLVIAGRNPSKDLLMRENEKIKIIPNPSEDEMKKWIADAHIHVLPFFQQTGIKLKLIHSLYAGRFCISNDKALESSLRDEIIFALDGSNFKKQIIQYFNQDFSEIDLEKRKMNLFHFDNCRNAQLILDLIDRAQEG